MFRVSLEWCYKTCPSQLNFDIHIYTTRIYHMYWNCWEIANIKARQMFRCRVVYTNPEPSQVYSHN